MRAAGLGALALLAPVALAAAAPARAGEAAVERFTGVARGPDGQVRYLEAHEIRRDGEGREEAVTTYRAPDGALLATLRSDFSRHPFLPDYVFEDRRRGVVESVAVEGGQATLVAGSRRRALPVPEGRLLVAGQGLDRLVRARLEDLRRGEVLRVDFAFPSRQASYAFTVRGRPAAPGAATLPVRVEIDSWVLRLFADAMECEYDLASGRLVRYRGPTNLEDDGGGHPVVTITYDRAPTSGAGPAAGDRHAAR